MDDQKKNYRLTYLDGFDVTVEVDHAVLTDEKLRYWTDCEELILECGTPLKAFLTILCRNIMLRSVVEFDLMETYYKGKADGFPPFDGTHGITLITYEDFEFDGDVTITEETDDASRRPQL